jgi:hypothetical protein
MIDNFIWKYIHLEESIVREIQKKYLDCLPTNNHFFQEIKLDITEFLGLEVQRFVLIQAAPNAVGRIHTDWRPANYGDQLALNIPLLNCENSTTSLWKSDYTPPVQYTDNGQPYNFYDPNRCVKIAEFKLIYPTIFRTDLPHSVDNPSNTVRKAISIRFKQDPWQLIHD